jgi:hypothetical protein
MAKRPADRDVSVTATGRESLVAVAVTSFRWRRHGTTRHPTGGCQPPIRRQLRDPNVTHGEAAGTWNRAVTAPRKIGDRTLTCELFPAGR